MHKSYLNIPSTILTLLLINGCSLKPISIEGDKTFPLILAWGDPRPTVLIAHGCDGPKNISYSNWAMEVNNWGYNGIVVDSFLVRGHKNLCYKGIIVPPTTRAEDFEEVAKWVKNQTWHKGGIAVIGFSHGASTALNIANNKNNKNIDAVVSYYPYCGKQNGQDFIGQSIQNPIIPAQVHLADKDYWTPPYLCGKMEGYEVYHYTNATHGFDQPFKNRTIFGNYLAYDAEAHTTSLNRVKIFLNKTISIKE
jgi:dienelactone hydrolase